MKKLINNSNNIAHEKSKSFILSFSGSAPSLCALGRGCMTGRKELLYLTNLAGLAGVNSSHKIVVGLQAALRELTDTVAVITFN